MQNNLNGSFTPVIIYDNADTNKVMILKDNKGKAGVYQWTHKESGKFYIGSAADLSKRLRTYYSFSHLNRNKSMYINNALLLHGYSAFSFTILEIISISDLTKVPGATSAFLYFHNVLNIFLKLQRARASETRKLILLR